MTAPLAYAHNQRVSLVDHLWTAAAIAALVIYTGVIIVRDSVFGVSGISTAQLRFLAVPLTGLALFALLMRFREAPRLLLANAWLIALVAFACASTLWSVDERTTNVRAIALVMSAICAFGLVARFNGWTLVRIVAIAMSVGTTLSVLFWALGDPMVQDTLALIGVRGVFTHKNLLGQCIVIALVTGAGLAVRRNVFDRILGCFVVFSALQAMLIAQSSTAYVAAAVGLAALALFILISRPWLPRIVQPAILVFAAAAVILTFAFRAEILHALGRDENLTGRDAIWAYVLEQIQDRPILGYGYRAYFTAPQNVDEIERVLEHAYDQAHNSALQVLLDLGVIGLALLALFVLVGAWRSKTAVFDPVRKIWLALIAALLFNSLTEALIMSPTGFAWLVFQIAVIALYVAKPNVQAHVIRPAMSWRGPAYRLRR